jgi:uncharacterized membrane protein YeaQ/YmgE (transglycosylase-associated protein family)
VRAHMLKSLMATLLVGTLCVSQAAPALAQATEGDRVKGDIAGTVGLGLLGAEVGLFLPPAFNLQDHWWAWVLFPAITAAGGAVAGAFAFEPRNPEPAVTVSILGAGFLLAVPALVGASALSTYRRDRDIERAESGGLLRFGKRGPELGAPNITTASVFSAAEQARYGLPQKTSTRLTLVSGRF